MHPFATAALRSETAIATSTHLGKALVRLSLDPLRGSYPFCNLPHEMRIVGLRLDIMCIIGHIGWDSGWDKHCH